MDMSPTGSAAIRSIKMPGLKTNAILDGQRRRMATLSAF